MNKIRGRIAELVGLAVLAGVVAMAALMFSTAGRGGRGAEPTAAPVVVPTSTEELTFKSPVQPPTATPLAEATPTPTGMWLSFGTPSPKPTPSRVITYPTPLPKPPYVEPTLAPGEVAKGEGNWTEPPPATPEWYPVNSLEDVAAVVLNDSFFQVLLNDPTYKSPFKGAVPGTPLLVEYIPENGWDNYVVPFYKDGRVCGIAAVGVKDGRGVLSAWGGTDLKQYPRVSAAEARTAVEKAGHQVVGEPRLVFRLLLEGTHWASPFWEVHTTDGQTFYVIYTLGPIEVYNASDVHPIR